MKLRHVFLAGVAFGATAGPVMAQADTPAPDAATDAAPAAAEQSESPTG